MTAPVYFVTGASGFVGRRLCLLLSARGARVKALVRQPNPWLASRGVEVTVGELWAEALLGKCLAGADYVIHCAADASFGNGEHYRRENLELTEFLLGMVTKYLPGLRRFVFVSTIGAIDRPRGDDCRNPLDESSLPYPVSDYGKSKLAAERAVAVAGLPFAIIRPTMVVGEEMRVGSHFAVFVRQAIRRTGFSRIAWPGCFSVLHVDDLASAIFELSTHPDAVGQTFFCAGEPFSIAEGFTVGAPDIRRVPLAPMLGMLRPILRWAPFSVKALLLPALVASDQKLRNLGWSPAYSAAEAVATVAARELARVDPSELPEGVTVVTGAASGLGFALVEALAPKRRNLLLIDRNAAGLEQLRDRFPHCEVHVIDLADWPALLQFVESPQWQALDVTELYAFAGFGARGAVQDIPLAVQRDMFTVNVLARLALARSAIANMRRRQFGRVVFISSSSAFQPLPMMAAYAASNSGLLSLGEAWSYEVSGEGVQMMTVCPGGMQTNFQKSAGVKELEGEKLMLPGEAVAAIFKGLAAQRPTLVVSTRAHAMAMLARLLPRNWSLRLWGRLMEKMR